MLSSHLFSASWADMSICIRLLVGEKLLWLRLRIHYCCLDTLTLVLNWFPNIYIFNHWWMLFSALIRVRSMLCFHIQVVTLITGQLGVCYLLLCHFLQDSITVIAYWLCALPASTAAPAVRVRSRGQPAASWKGALPTHRDNTIASCPSTTPKPLIYVPSPRWFLSYMLSAPLVCIPVQAYLSEFSLQIFVVKSCPLQFSKVTVSLV